MADNLLAGDIVSHTWIDGIWKVTSVNYANNTCHCMPQDDGAIRAKASHLLNLGEYVTFSADQVEIDAVTHMSVCAKERRARAK